MKRDISLSLTVARNAHRSAAIVEILFKISRPLSGDHGQVFVSRIVASFSGLDSKFRVCELTYDDRTSSSKLKRDVPHQDQLLQASKTKSVRPRPRLRRPW